MTDEAPTAAPSSWVVDKTKTVTRTIVHPKTKEEASIVLRPLDAGDVADVDELAGIAMQEDGGGKFSLFVHKLAMCEAAIVSWSLPDPPTRDVIRRLPSPVIEQIFGFVELFEGHVEADEKLPTTPPTPAADSEHRSEDVTPS